jgi:hypothetical protein
MNSNEKEMVLREVVNQPAYRYYCRGGIAGVIVGVLGMCWLIWRLINDNATSWGIAVFCIAMIALLEGWRQRERFDALVELMEIEKKRRTDSEQVAPR